MTLKIDPLLSLAISMQSNKGIYALLVGSGVSRAAGIPTGWQITLDLARRLAEVSGEDYCADVERWYVERYDEEPDYSKLLRAVAKTSAERSQLLRGYFEPTAQERDEGKKLPTKAHRAIAQLVAGGYVRVIITTNFDRLMELALDEQGIYPSVISTPDAVEGMRPLIHTNCAVIKVHGDYLDARIKNTPEELAKYDKRMNRLLDQVFDECGLITCGWSAEWDIALLEAFQRCKSRRFTTYWTTLGAPAPAAQRLIDWRMADVIHIQGADPFFYDLVEKLISIEKLGEQSPLAPAVAVERVKRYIVDDKRRIDLHDLITSEVEGLRETASSGEMSLLMMDTQNLKRAVLNRLSEYDAASNTLVAAIATGCYWGGLNHHYLWKQSLDRLVNLPYHYRQYEENWIKLRLYPALLVWYAAGIASLASSHFDTLSEIGTKVRGPYLASDLIMPLVRMLNTYTVMYDFRGLLPTSTTSYKPMGSYIASRIRPAFQMLIPSEQQFNDYFDGFEYIAALLRADLDQKAGDDILSLLEPFDNVGYMPRRMGLSAGVKMVSDEINRLSSDWPLIKMGLFDGSVQRLLELKAVVDKHIR